MTLYLKSFSTINSLPFLYLSPTHLVLSCFFSHLPLLLLFFFHGFLIFLSIYSFIFLPLFFLFIARKAWQGQPLDFCHKTPPIKTCLSRYDNRVITDSQNGISHCISSFLSFLPLSFSLHISFLSSRSCLLDLFFSYFLLSLSFT